MKTRRLSRIRCGQSGGDNRPSDSQAAAARVTMRTTSHNATWLRMSVRHRGRVSANRLPHGYHDGPNLACDRRGSDLAAPHG
jgi:hypothetical protein